MEERLGRLLSMTAKAAKEAFDQQLNEVGSSLTTYLILLHTAYYPDLSQRELAGHLGIEGSTLTRQLDRLVADGLVRRGSHARDRRVSVVEVTAAGKDHLNRAEARAAESDAELRRLFTDDELHELVVLLNRIRDRYAKEPDAERAAG